MPKKAEKTESEQMIDISEKKIVLVKTAFGVKSLGESAETHVATETVVAEKENILLAAQSCPTLAILIFDEEGNQLFPEL